ncbi:MAG TPA: alpha/beta hydrolase [Ferruginibacter sp.]|nr:alpha/beta hydrolase [Ferruginibacter sp.]
MIRYLKHTIPTLLFFVLFLSCNSRKEAGPFEGIHLDKNKIQFINNIEYGPNSKQALDIYLPANRTDSTRVLFYIHGGGWCAGDKDEAAFFSDYFLQAGYAFISIGYRLTNTRENNYLPEQLADVSKAIDFSLKYSNLLRVSNKKSIIMGCSAGAHLSLLYAYSAENAGKIKAAIAVATPTDLTDTIFMKGAVWPGINGGTLITWLLKDSITVNPLLWKKASPVFSISSTSPPTYFIHGKNDGLIPFYHASRAIELLNAKNIPSGISLVENAGHDLLINDIFIHLNKAESFIRKNIP